MKSLKLLSWVALALFSTIALSDQIALGKVEENTNIVGAEKQFGVRMSSGATGPCATSWIYIKAANMDIDSYKNAFSLVTTALAADKRIRVHNYSSNSCDGATFIGLFKN